MTNGERNTALYQKMFSSLFPYIDVSATVSYLALSGNPEII